MYCLAGEGPSQELYWLNNIWMMVATFLVFIMHLGFAMLETGLTRSKNTVNILFKNTGIIAIGLLTYAFVGFGLMYPGDFNGIFGYCAAALPLNEMFATDAESVMQMVATACGRFLVPRNVRCNSGNDCFRAVAGRIN